MIPIYEFNENHIQQLHELYQQEWWTKDRTFSETEQGVYGSQVSIGLVDNTDNLQGFARVITDFTFKALIFDVIVSEKHRGLKLGNRLLELIQNHNDLKRVKHFELYCLPELLPFYEKHGFSSEVDGIKLVRRINA